jgi:hypothetical protein
MTRDESIALLVKGLGWPQPEKFEQVLPRSERSPRQKTVWYESESEGDLQLFVSTYYAIVVYALRYRLYTGWIPITPPRSQNKLAAEIERLEPWIHRRHFAAPEARKQFRQLHPECAGYTRDRIQHERPWMHTV